jgi:hypothetical protein
MLIEKKIKKIFGNGNNYYDYDKINDVDNNNNIINNDNICWYLIKNVITMGR